MKALWYSTYTPVAFIVVFPFLLTLLDSPPLAPALNASTLVGLSAFVVAGAGYIWCAYQLATEGRGTPSPHCPTTRLASAGPYEFVRNPVFLCFALALAGQCLVYRSAAMLVYSLTIMGAMYVFAVFFEEPALKRKFGDQYRAYCDAVPRWVPRFRLRTPDIEGAATRAVAARRATRATCAKRTAV